MKNIILLIIVACLCGCGQNTNKSNTQNQEPSFLLKERLDSLVEKSPNLMNNDITKQDFADLLKSELQKYRGDTLPFLSELPLQFEMSLKYPDVSYNENAGKYVVKFEFGSSKCTLSKEYETTFIVLSVIDKETASQLVERSLYNINGTFRDFANNSKETGFVLPSGKCMIRYPKVSKSSLYNTPFIDLGVLIIDNLSFTPIN